MTSDSRAHAILSRQAELETERSQHEAVWEAVSEICDPDAPDIWGRQAGAASKAEPQERRSPVSTPTPSTRPPTGWPRAGEPDHPAVGKMARAVDRRHERRGDRRGKEWAEALRDFLFALQYSANSNFVPATQACLRNVVRYGPAYLYVEEGFGGTPTAMPRFPWSRAISRATAGGRSTPSTAAMSARRGRRRTSWL
jgi:hypothetical protein